jgi:hypothetical protein
MDVETINLIFQLLQRVDIKGNEVPAFNKVTQALAAEAQRLQNPEPEETEEI